MAFVPPISFKFEAPRNTRKILGCRSQSRVQLAIGCADKVELHAFSVQSNENGADLNETRTSILNKSNIGRREKISQHMIPLDVKDGVESIDFAPVENMSDSARFLIGSQKKGILVYQLSNNADLLWNCETTHNIIDSRFLADGNVISALDNSTVHIHSKGVLQQSYSLPSTATSLCSNPTNANMFWAGTRTGFVFQFDTRMAPSVQTILPQGGIVSSVDCCPSQPTMFVSFICFTFSFLFHNPHVLELNPKVLYL
eukprot:TRINITY_DN6239_c0_g1_i2.p1 TRINITY_DN6239_c0_g1~~TRINITY_DN6239_c0_g1_i2.p1  ORF type:complete len:256 (+),score=46.54 TRINITY_DN6239_c0_g1_i2:69-836(+)